MRSAPSSLQKNDTNGTPGTPSTLTSTGQTELKDSIETSNHGTKNSLVGIHDPMNNESLRNMLVKQGYELTKMKRSMLERAKNLSQLKIFYIGALVVPIIISLWFASAILFPPGAREKAPFLLWTNGELKYDQGQPSICPRASICSEGVLQIILISLARLSAFASYVVMGITFLSKMHSLIHFLSNTYLSLMIPFESLHDVHTLTGKMFGWLAFLHTLTHYIRYVIRKDADQLGSQVHISGLIAMIAMATVTLSMSSFVRNRVRFEKRFNAHWAFLLVVLALLFHTSRTRTIVLIFFCAWAMDYFYGVIFRIHRLGVVEFTPVGDDAGTQMLWRNPEGFNPKSGEYVYVKLPWLNEGGEQWHPFSIYLREATKEGLNSLLARDPSNAGLGDFSDFETFTDLGTLESNISTKNHDNLYDFTRSVLNTEFGTKRNDPTSLVMYEARQSLKRFDTTQVFISPVGDWSKQLLEQVNSRKQLQSCWVKGPFTSPYFIAQDFSHIVLTASGIGITPALGVMGQYPGFTRTKILIWSTRSKTMLQFFAPLLRDAHLSVIFYTGKEKLSPCELTKIQSHGNIFIQQSRPKSLTATIGSLITMFENEMNEGSGAAVARDVMDVEKSHRNAWCLLYCGGSKVIRDQIEAFAIDKDLGWECELFDW